MTMEGLRRRPQNSACMNCQSSIASALLSLPVNIPVLRSGGAAGLGAGQGEFPSPFAAVFGFDLLALVEALRLLLLAFVQKHATGLAAHGWGGGSAVVAGAAQGGGLGLSFGACVKRQQGCRQKQGGGHNAFKRLDLHADFGLSLPRPVVSGLVVARRCGRGKAV